MTYQQHGYNNSAQIEQDLIQAQAKLKHLMQEQKRLKQEQQRLERERQQINQRYDGYQRALNQVEQKYGNVGYNPHIQALQKKKRFFKMISFIAIPIGIFFIILYLILRNALPCQKICDAKHPYEDNSNTYCCQYSNKQACIYRSDCMPALFILYMIGGIFILGGALSFWYSRKIRPPPVHV